MNKNLLLIEDDKFFQNFYLTKLTEKGFNVTLAADGKEGLDKLQNGTFDLMLLDLIMPRLNGFEVLKKRSESDKFKSIPVIVFSTLSQDKDLSEAKNLGANDYINKTFYNFDDLLNKINKLLAINN